MYIYIICLSHSALDAAAPGAAFPARRASAREVVLEPEEADGSRTGMRTDDGAERRRDVDLRLRAKVRDEGANGLLPVGRVRVCDADVQARRLPRAVRERARELLHRLLVSAHALDRQHRAVLDREDRLDVEQVAGKRRGLADAAALLEELERVDGEDQPGVALEALDELVDLLVARAALEPPLDREAEHRNRRRGRPGIDDAHLVPELRGRRPSALERAGQL